MTPSCLRLEFLEPRHAPANLFVDNPGDFVITNDITPAGLSAGDTVTWDPGAGTGHPNVPLTGLIFGTTAFSTIASAIASAATTGDAIRVGPGTFNETLVVNKSVNMQGNQVGVDATTRTGLPETVVVSAGTAFTLSQPNTRINGFTIVGTGTNSTGIGMASALTGLTVSNNIIADHNTGLRLNTAAGGSLTTVSQNLFRNNDSTAGSDAILSDLQLENATIARNVVTGAHPGTAIEIAGSTGTGLDVAIERNTLTGPGGATTADGIRIGNSVPAATQAAIRNNFVNGWDVGVVLPPGRPGITVRGNHLAGNVQRALSNTGPGEYDAGFNFYGVTTEAEVEAELSGPFDFRPFLTDGTDADPAAAGFQPTLRPTLVTATTATYLDPDGDLVTLKVSKGALADADFTFALPERGDGLILSELNLGDDGSEFAKANITITARRTAGGGDGLASQVQHIVATGVDLGTVTVRGNLGGLRAGDAVVTAASPAVTRVDVLSATNIGGNQAFFRLNGPVGAFVCRGDLVGSLDVVGGGSIGSLVVGGSVLPLPGIETLTSFIHVSGTASSITIRGDLMGTLNVTGDVGRLAVGGNVRGGEAFNAGKVEVRGKAGSIVIGGSLIGGTDHDSGLIEVNGRVASLVVRGSVLGGNSDRHPFRAGGIQIGSAGAVVIGGSLIGGNGIASGQFFSLGDVASLTITGSVVAGQDHTAQATGGIRIDGRAGPIVIGRDLRSDVTDSINFDIIFRPVIVSVLGRPAPATQADALALRSLTVGGSVYNAQILIGYAGPFSARNPDAAAGPILVKGGWTAATLAVGVQAGADTLFGTADDAAIVPAGPFADAPGVLARVASFTVRGPATGSSATIAGTSSQFNADHFGLVAEVFGPVTIAGTLLPLTAAPDQFGIGPTFDFRLLEV